MRKIILATLLLCACSKPKDDLQGIADEVIKKKEGVLIEFKPLVEDKGVDVTSKKF